MERSVSQTSHENVSLQTSLEEISHVDPKIINISQKNFSIHEIELLKRGLKFTPTPKKNDVDVIKDTEEFCKKLRLREFFQNSENSDESLVRNKVILNPTQTETNN